MAWHTKKFWRQISPVLFLLSTGIYWVKTTTSTPSTSFTATTTNITIPDLQAGELNLLTYNIAGLPEMLSAAKTPRAASMKEIAKKINRFDIVNVQEDFHYHNQLYSLHNNHRFRTPHRSGIPYGDGLNTLSKHPIMETRRIAWNACHGADCLATKGFLFTRIQLSQKIFVDVYNLHATARDEKPAVRARQKNMIQLARYINTHSIKNAVIVMGDFNAHFGAPWDNMHWFVEHTQLQDVWALLINKDRYPQAQSSFTSQEKLDLTDSCESIDKIFFRSSKDIDFIPHQYKIEDQYFSNEKGIALSDHLAVSCKIHWKTRGLKHNNL